MDDGYLVTASDTHGSLAEIVRTTKAFPGWSFALVHKQGASYLVITIDGHNNYDPDEPFCVSHEHPVPIATYNPKTWRRWIHTQCLRTLTHELGESLRFGTDDAPLRPFVPMHGPGEDPYTVHEWRSEEDARMTQRGKLRTGPV